MAEGEPGEARTTRLHKALDTASGLPCSGNTEAVAKEFCGKASIRPRAEGLCCSRGSPWTKAELCRLTATLDPLCAPRARWRLTKAHEPHCSFLKPNSDAAVMNETQCAQRPLEFLAACCYRVFSQSTDIQKHSYSHVWDPQKVFTSQRGSLSWGLRTMAAR